MSQPILRNAELEKLRQVVARRVRVARRIDITWPVERGPEGHGPAVDRICAEAADAIAEGANIIILSDREVSSERAPIPSLLAVASVHHHLVREGTRLRAGLVVESGEPREVHHIACLIGYGASAINPYLMLESLRELRDAAQAAGEHRPRTRPSANVVKAIGKGLLKMLSKMGISTIQLLLRRADLRGGGLHPDLDRPPLHRHAVAHRRRRHRRAGAARRWTATRRGYPRARRTAEPACPWAASTVAPRRRAPHVGPGDDRAAPAGRARPTTATACETYERFADLVNEENARRARCAAC